MLVNTALLSGVVVGREENDRGYLNKEREKTVDETRWARRKAGGERVPPFDRSLCELLLTNVAG